MKATLLATLLLATALFSHAFVVPLTLPQESSSQCIKPETI